jgi:flagellar export protein FliJ
LRLTGLRREIETAQVCVDEATRNLEQASSALSEAHQRRKSLERHREREELEWRRGQARKEARDIDEIAVSRHRAREEESHGP